MKDSSKKNGEAPIEKTKIKSILEKYRNNPVFE
jgi:hypothetical protein